MTASKSCGSIEVVGSVRLRVIDGLTGLGWAFHFLGSGTVGSEIPVVIFRSRLHIRPRVLGACAVGC